MDQWRERVEESKDAMRQRLQALPFSEKLKILERLRDRTLAIKRSSLARREQGRLANTTVSQAHNGERFQLE
jgi:hypothetical protein